MGNVSRMVHRVLVLADIHGNDDALGAVLAEADPGGFDAVAIIGDITWGSFPQETYELLAPLSEKLIAVSGNSDRALLELRSGVIDQPSERERWMLEAHSSEVRGFLVSLPQRVSIEISGFGSVLFTHGSPRGDEELVTPETPPERVREFMDGVSESVLGTGHTHVGYVRSLDGWTLFNPGSIGMPYEGKRGAFWATLEGGAIDLHRTDYDVEAFVQRTRATDDPAVDKIAPILLDPPTREEAIAQSEKLVFSG